MFAQRTRLTLLGLGLITTGLVACQGQQQQQQQKEPGQPIDFNAAGFEGVESGQFALLGATCDPTANPVVITVASGEFAYLYMRAADSTVIVNTNAAGGGQCTFASTKKISIVAAETSGTHDHKVLIDFLSGQFSPGDSSNVGIAVDLKTAGVNQVMFRGTTNPDVFTLGTKTGVSYLAFATAASTPVTVPTFANVSLTNVSDVTITAGPGDDVISGQATSLTSPAGLAALDGAISLTVHGGDGNDQITSGAASSGDAHNSLNGNAGSDIFRQPAALASDVISGGMDPTITRTLTGTITGTDVTTATTTTILSGTTTATATSTTSANATLTDTQTASMTKNVTATGTVSLTATVTKATTATATGTVSGTQTATGTTTWTGTYVGTGVAVGTTKSFTATLTGTTTVSATLTLTATGTLTGTMNPTGTKTATASGSGSDTKSNTQTYAAVVTSITNTYVQTDTSTDVVDYSARTAPIKVTLGDETASASASATVVLPKSGGIRSYDSFKINDGDLTTPVERVVEFHRAGDYAVGDITVPSNGAADLVVDETITIDDGAHPVTFNFAITGTKANTGTSTSTNTNAIITVDSDDDRATVAQKVAAGIRSYQTATWTGTSTGTATMVSTSIIPNVTVKDPDPDNSDVISVQDRNAVAVSPFLGTTSAKLTAADGTAAPLWNANGTSAIAVALDETSGVVSAADVATAVAGAITTDGSLGITASSTGTIVTLTATGGAAVKAAFAVTLQSGSFDITVLTNGTPAAGPGPNDGDIAGSGEKDSILNDVEMVIGGSNDDVIDATHATTIAHTLLGMAGNDTLTIGVAAGGGNVLYGGPGSDHLLGGGGVDTLYGGDGNDFVAGGPGNDIIDGDGPNCLVTSGSVYGSTLCIASGTPTGAQILATASATPGSNYLDYNDRTAPVTVNLGSVLTGASRASQIGVSSERDDVVNCSNLRGGSGADILTGNAADNIIYGGPGDDTINGGAGNDSLYGDNGDDTVSGDAGDDYIYGGGGVNKLYGDGVGYTGTAGINMVDNSQGRNGEVDCGAGDMDILFSDGAETGTSTCELK